nr:hypothetical protein [Tanacetum cinerariifolium]
PRRKGDLLGRAAALRQPRGGAGQRGATGLPAHGPGRESRPGRRPGVHLGYASWGRHPRPAGHRGRGRAATRARHPGSQPAGAGYAAGLRQPQAPGGGAAAYYLCL